VLGGSISTSLTKSWPAACPKPVTVSANSMQNEITIKPEKLFEIFITSPLDMNMEFA
jgi:hypothetical protein